MEQNKKRFLEHINTKGKTKSWTDFSVEYGFPTGDAARTFYKRNKSRNKPFLITETTIPDSSELKSYVVNQETNTAIIESDYPLSTEEAVLDYCKLDKNQWEVKEIWTKEKQSKDFTHPLSENGVLSLYETTAKLLPKHTKTIDIKQEFLDFLNNYKPVKPTTFVEIGKADQTTSGNALILSLTDLHLDKKSVLEETESYGGIELIKSRAINACFDLVDRAVAAHTITKIIIIGGNDFFHANSAANTTQKGTLLDVEGRWHESFKEGLVLMTTIIDYCKAIAPVDYYTVLGNHSPEREWYLSVALEAFYKQEEHVTIETINRYRKYFSYGTSAFMLTHELGKRASDLPLIFATERPELFAKSKYRTVLTGHLHKQQETQFISTNENYGIIYKILPSLCATDKWHYDNNFTGNQKSCIALIVNEDYGTIAELIYNE